MCSERDTHLCDNARKVFRFFAEWLTDYPQVRTAYIDVVKNEIKGVNV